MTRPLKRFFLSSQTGFAVSMNIICAVFAIVGLVLYFMDLGDTDLLWMCEHGLVKADLHVDSCIEVALLAQVRILSLQHIRSTNFHMSLKVLLVSSTASADLCGHDVHRSDCSSASSLCLFCCSGHQGSDGSDEGVLGMDLC